MWLIARRALPFAFVCLSLRLLIYGFLVSLSLSTGIFLSDDLWHDELLKGKSFEFKIWPLPSTETIKARKVAHLLNELPLPASRRNASVELRADSLNRTTQFQSILKSENLCFESSLSKEKLLVYVGDAAFMSSVSFGSNRSLIIVPLSMKDFVMSGKCENTTNERQSIVSLFQTFQIIPTSRSSPKLTPLTSRTSPTRRLSLQISSPLAQHSWRFASRSTMQSGETAIELYLRIALILPIARFSTIFTFLKSLPPQKYGTC
jgi:hypothetical protein